MAPVRTPSKTGRLVFNGIFSSKRLYPAVSFQMGICHLGAGDKTGRKYNLVFVEIIKI